MLIESWFDEITTCPVTLQGGLIPPVHEYRWALKQSDVLDLACLQVESDLRVVQLKLALDAREDQGGRPETGIEEETDWGRDQHATHSEPDKGVLDRRLNEPDDDEVAESEEDAPRKGHERGDDQRQAGVHEKLCELREWGEGGSEIGLKCNSEQKNWLKIRKRKKA